MINVVFNKDLLALPSRLQATVTVGVDPYLMYGTPYGMFIPFTASGNQFVRWVQKGMVDRLPKKAVLSYLIHISNAGEVLLVSVDTEESLIFMTPYVSETFAVMSGNREIAEAYSELVKNCTNIADAIHIVDEGDPLGLYDPILFFVEEWVQYAKEKGYKDTFYWTEFSDIYDAQKK